MICWTSFLSSALLFLILLTIARITGKAARAIVNQLPEIKLPKVVKSPPPVPKTLFIAGSSLDPFLTASLTSWIAATKSPPIFVFPRPNNCSTPLNPLNLLINCNAATKANTLPVAESNISTKVVPTSTTPLIKSELIRLDHIV